LRRSTKCLAGSSPGCDRRCSLCSNYHPASRNLKEGVFGLGGRARRGVRTECGASVCK
jgi:hypothetical protein